MPTETIVFLHDYRGVRTNERFYLAGEEAEMEDVLAAVLVELGHAEYVEVDLEEMTRDELEALAEEMGVMPEEGSGADGNVLKDDILEAVLGAEESNSEEDEDPEPEEE